MIPAADGGRNCPFFFNGLTGEYIMDKLKQILLSLLSVMIILGIIGCAGGPRGKLPRVEKPTENELKQDWQNYTVYFRRGTAFVYKLKDDRKIILDAGWVAVTTESMMTKSRISDLTRVKKILGQNNEMYGYLVHRSADQVNVAIIDGNTVRLYYHYIRTSGGP